MTTTPILSISELARRHDEFWALQGVLLRKRMADPALVESAFETLREEQIRGVSAYFQTTLEATLERAEKARRYYLGNQARKGPAARRKDVLSELIERAVRSDPMMTETRLLAHLKRLHCPGDVVHDIDEKTITYDQYGRLRDAPVSGLKHRLTRARKKVLSLTS